MCNKFVDDQNRSNRLKIWWQSGNSVHVIGECQCQSQESCAELKARDHTHRLNITGNLQSDHSKINSLPNIKFFQIDFFGASFRIKLMVPPSQPTGVAYEFSGWYFGKIFKIYIYRITCLLVVFFLLWFNNCKLQKSLNISETGLRPTVWHDVAISFYAPSGSG